MRIVSVLVARLFLIVIVMASVPAWAETASCDPVALDFALTPAQSSTYPGRKATQALGKTVPAAADAVFIGDSIMAGWRSGLPKAFPDTRVFDFAVGGDKVANILWRFAHIDVSALRPRVAVLLIGTNDLAARVPPCAVVAGIDKILAVMGEIWPETQIYVLTITPRGHGYHDLDDARLEVNRSILSLAARHDNVHAVAIDDVAFTCGIYAETQTAAGEAGHCRFYIGDDLHFSAAGYEELRRILMTATSGKILH